VFRLLGVMVVFVEHPYLAAIIGIFLLAVGWRTRRRTAKVVGVIWLLYALYETGMQQRLLCSGECNIRIDMLLISPVLLIGLLAAFVSLVRAMQSPRPRG
jgi:hypothetical protein